MNIDFKEKTIVFESRDEAQKFIQTCLSNETAKEISEKIQELEERINNDSLLLGHFCIDRICVVSDEYNYYIVYLTDVSDDSARAFETEQEVINELEEMLEEKEMLN